MERTGLPSEGSAKGEGFFGSCVAYPASLPELGGIRGESLQVEPLGVHASGPDRKIEVFRDGIKTRQEGEIDPFLELLAVFIHAEASREWGAADQVGKGAGFLFQDLELPV